MKTVNQLIIELQSLREDLRNKPVVVIGENGEEFPARAKLGSETVMDAVSGNVSKIVITYE